LIDSGFTSERTRSLCGTDRSARSTG
jgi:hypothetical protein